LNEKAKYARITSLKVTDKPIQLLGENPKRKAFLVYNNGSVNIEILDGQTRKYGEGIPVAAGAQYDNDDCYGAYWIVAASGTQDVRVEEDTD
jgi:hypothetical protein